MMGLTSFKGDHPTLRDAKIAKNYLSAEELKVLNNLVSGYFDFAEVQEKIKKQTLVPIDGGLLSPYTEEMVILSVLLFVPEIPARRFL